MNELIYSKIVMVIKATSNPATTGQVFVFRKFFIRPIITSNLNDGNSGEDTFG